MRFLLRVTVSDGQACEEYSHFTQALSETPSYDRNILCDLIAHGIAFTHDWTQAHVTWVLECDGKPSQ